MKGPSHRFLASKWLVHNQFMGLGNPLEVVVHYLLIGKIVSFSHWNGFSKVSALVYIVTHWTRPMVSHDIKLLSCHDFTKLLHHVVSQPWENTEFVVKLIMALT